MNPPHVFHIFHILPPYGNLHIFRRQAGDLRGALLWLREAAELAAEGVEGVEGEATFLALLMGCDAWWLRLDWGYNIYNLTIFNGFVKPQRNNYSIVDGFINFYGDSWGWIELWADSPPFFLSWEASPWSW